MRLGFHLSISGGLALAMDRGADLNCEAAQIFSRNPRGWAVKPLEDEAAQEFRQARDRAGIRPVAVHLPYLPNLAAPDGELARKSVDSLAEEMSRAARLDAEFVVVHPGHVRPEESVETGLERVAQNAALALSRGPESGTRLVLETTSGQRGELGTDFGQLARLVADIEAEGPWRVGVCLDTAHIWAAGYDLAGPRGPETTLEEFDRALGLSRLDFIHLNDSLSELGGRRDRHAVPGQGRIGSRNLARFIRRPELAGLAGVMETPRTTPDEDRAILNRVKRWRHKA